MKRFSQKRNAVSPVIATILLVAITVVLVGILFAWIIPLIDQPSKPTPDINIALSTEVDGEETYFKVLITEVNAEPTLNNIKYRVYDSGQRQIEEMRADSEVYGNLAHLAHYEDELLGVGFSDTDADGHLSVDDYFLIKQHFNKKYNPEIDISGGKMSLIYTPTGSMLEDIELIK